MKQVRQRDDDTRWRTYTWDDPSTSATAAREMDGLAFLQAVAAGTISSPPILATLDFGWVSIEPGEVIFEIIPAEFHYNTIGSVHGGVYATVCDSACGCAVHSRLPAGTSYTSLDLAVKFLRPITIGTGRLRCQGVVTHLGGRIALAEAQLTDQEGKLYAQATSSCLIFQPE